MSSVARTVTLLGGCAAWGELREFHRKRVLLRAIERGDIIRVARGRYVTSATAAHRELTETHTAVLSHLGAALHHGWKVKTVPAKPTLSVARKRHVSAELRRSAEIHYADLLPTDTHDRVTLPLRTVLDCARYLPFDEALVVADSALRSGSVDPHQLIRAAGRLKGPGSGQVMRVAEHADGRAANPLESVLRAIVLDIPGIEMVPQHTVAEPGVFAVVDLADPTVRLVLEAEGFEYHGSRGDWRKDCRRYTEIVSAGWWVLRFTYEDVMHHPEVVRAAIERWLANRPDRQDIAA
ncbi:conserved hypothetical protein [Nostocoides japonicum T1-X7]|uniref:DUF559 domain-containing protein n=1 Tax=Nostocoides japonicum T1-X7 TaxID=1194083 RepID=A0A077LVU0_9MICO|nr:DUF559 domain-containing protein [Tetrasphaera japonica]CCH77811.1 conserved hypothetical protein [Tetrasphaera japonica T1-X7]